LHGVGCGNEEKEAGDYTWIVMERREPGRAVECNPVRPKIKPSSDGFSLLVLQKTAGFASGFLLTFPAKSRFLLFLIRNKAASRAGY
jgi:hypothetical protein